MVLLGAAVEKLGSFMGPALGLVFGLSAIVCFVVGESSASVVFSGVASTLP